MRERDVRSNDFFVSSLSGDVSVSILLLVVSGMVVDEIILVGAVAVKRFWALVNA